MRLHSGDSEGRRGMAAGETCAIVAVGTFFAHNVLKNFGQERTRQQRIGRAERVFFSVWPIFQ